MPKLDFKIVVTMEDDKYVISVVNHVNLESAPLFRHKDWDTIKAQVDFYQRIFNCEKEYQLPKSDE